MKPLDAITPADIRTLYTQAVSLRKVAHRLVAHARAMLQNTTITALDRTRLQAEMNAAVMAVAVLYRRFEDPRDPLL